MTRDMKNLRGIGDVGTLNEGVWEGIFIGVLEPGCLGERD